MRVQGIFVSVLAIAAIAGPLPQAAASASSREAFQRFPKLPSIPRLPGQGKKPSGERAMPTRPGGNNAQLQREYRQEVAMLAYQINTSWSSKADNERIEKAVAEYRARVDRVAGTKFAGISAQDRRNLDGDLRAHYDTLAETTDREVAWAEQMISNIGVADAAYNEMLVLDTALYGAVTLYPDNTEYAAAKAKVANVLGKFGSRSGANDQKEAIIIANAKKVKMPSATERNKSIENMFRRAWGTGGIPYTIQKIHIRGGWGVKRNRYGVVLGQTRDAAIAVKDPATGKCYLYDFTMIKETGGNVRRSSHAAKRMACENIPG